MVTICDCRKCELPPFPDEFLAEGLCIECWDREAGKHAVRTPEAIAARKRREKIRYQKQVEGMQPRAL